MQRRPSVHSSHCSVSPAPIKCAGHNQSRRLVGLEVFTARKTSVVFRPDTAIRDPGLAFIFLSFPQKVFDVW